MRVLITGAAGKTGKSIIKSLFKKNIPISALVHRSESVPEVKNLGVDNVIVGNLQDLDQMKLALQWGRLHIFDHFQYESKGKRDLFWNY